MLYNFIKKKPDESEKAIVNISGNLLEVSPASKRESHLISNGFVEYNPTLNVIDTFNSFWNSTEIELKRNLITNATNWFLTLPSFFSDSYSFSEISKDTTYEHYFEAIYGNTRFQYCKLGKSNWRRSLALKYKTIKKTGTCLSREMTIKLYTHENVKNAVETHLNCKFNDAKILSYPAFYKHKYRYVVANRFNGSIFGVSYDKTNPLTKSLFPLFQIETEYWSNVVPKNSKRLETFSFNKVTKELKLIDEAIAKSLHNSGISSCQSNLTKYDWVSMNSIGKPYELK